MGESSYIKIYAALEKTSECRALEQTLLRRIDSLAVTRVEWLLVRPSAIGVAADALPRFVVETCDGEFSKTTGPDLWIGADRFVAYSEVREVVKATFGVKGKVPTYFCKESTVVDGSGNNESFHAWIKRAWSRKHMATTEAAGSCLAVQINRILASEQLQVDKRAFLVQSAIADIKAALGAYDHLGKEVLKEAIDEYIIHSIVDS